MDRVTLKLTGGYSTIDEDGYIGQHPVVHLFGRDEHRRRWHVQVDGYRPYFAVRQDEALGMTEELADDDRVLRVEPYENGGDEHPVRGVTGERLTRIVTECPWHVGDLRESFTETWEADVQLVDRFCIDQGIRQFASVPEDSAEPTSGSAADLQNRTADSANSRERTISVDEIASADEDEDRPEVPPRVLTYDIEVEQTESGPAVVSEKGTEFADNPVTAITSHDRYTDEYRIWVLAHAAWGDVYLPSAEDLDGEVDGTVRDVSVYETDRELLADFVDYVERVNPDVLTGWNCIPGNAKVQMSNGLTKEMSEIECGDGIVGVDGEDVTCGVVEVKGKSHKTVDMLELQDGTEFEASPDHRVMVGDDGGVGWKTMDSISIGDYLLRPRILEVDDPYVPELFELISDDKLRYSKDTILQFKDSLPYGACARLAEEYGLSVGTTHHPHIGTWTPERCRWLADHLGIDDPGSGEVYRRGGGDVGRKITLHEMYLAGLIMSDGSMRSTTGIDFYNTEESLHQQFPTDNPVRWQDDGSGHQKVLDFKRMWAFSGLGIPIGDKNASEVDLSTVYQMPKEYVGRFMAGVFDGDGHIGESMTIAAASEDNREWYSKLLRRIGVYCDIGVENVRIPLSERNVSSLKKWITPHISHTKKTDRLGEESGKTTCRMDVCPPSLLDGPLQIDYAERSYDNGQNMMRWYNDVTDWDDWVFLRVDAVERGVDECAMYDIQTDVKSFVADDILVHNSSGFDTPYLVNRCFEEDVFGITNLSPTGDVETMHGEGQWYNSDLKGIVLFDLLTGLKKTRRHAMESYALENVADDVLDDVPKLDVDEQWAWEHDPEQFVEYSLRDVRAAVGINQEVGII